MIEAVSGLLTGIIFGAVLKKSRFCLMGLIRDIRLEKKRYNIALIASIIALEGLIYHSLVFAGLIRGTPYIAPFPALSVAAGSFLFGAGAVLAGGCLTMVLVKTGDGRLTGPITLITFIAAGAFVSAGPVNMLTYRFMSLTLAGDPALGRGTVWPILIRALVLAVCVSVMMKKLRAGKRRLRGSREGYMLLIGLVMGAGFLISDLVGRHYGFAIAMPILSWVFKVIRPAAIIGGCNVYDQKIGWGSFLVAGIVIGSLITSLIRREWNLVIPPAKTALKAALGGLLMGVGAILAQGCLLANGLVATAQGLLKGWYALVFLTIGIWTASRLLYGRLYE